MQIPDGVRIEDLPHEIMCLWVASMYNHPVGCSQVDKAMELYPEYFPVEVEYRRKMSMVPKQVSDAHMTELMALHNWWFSELPDSTKGLWYYSQHPEEWQDHWAASEALHKKYDKEEMERRLWNKYYTLYGLKKAPPTAEELQKRQDEENARQLKLQRQQESIDALKNWLENMDPDNPLGSL